MKAIASIEDGIIVQSGNRRAIKPDRTRGVIYPGAAETERINQLPVGFRVKFTRQQPFPWSQKLDKLLLPKPDPGNGNGHNDRDKERESSHKVIPHRMFRARQRCRGK